MSINIEKIKNKKFFNPLISSFLGALKKEGKGQKSYVIYINLLGFLKSNSRGVEPYLILVNLLVQLKPLVGLKSKKVAGISYQLPYPITEARANKIAVLWFYKALDFRSEKTFLEKLKGEFQDIRNYKGYALQKKNNHEKMALDNRPFLHFLKR
jgi:small subunit ribosomal protein S7